MMALAIDLLWLLIAAIILCAVVYLIIYGINTFVSPIPAKVVQGIWFIVLLLVIIAVLSMLAGGGGLHLRSPSFLR